MIPKRKVPQSGQQSQKTSSNPSSNPSLKVSSTKSAKTTSKQTKSTTNTSSQKQSDQSMPSIVELLQNQIEEDRKNARNKNQIKSRQTNSSSHSQTRQILQKKKNEHNNSSVATESRPPPQPNQDQITNKPNYVSIETSPASSTSKQTDTHKTEKVEMAAEAVGNDDAPAPKKMEPTGFTYFDKLNEKDIFLDPLKYF